MKMKTLLAACFGMSLAAAPVQAEVIDFSTYAPGTIIDGALDVLGVTFTSSTDRLMIGDFGGGNGLCAYDGSGCTGTLAIMFNNGANGLSLTYSGDDMADSNVFYEGQSDVLAFVGRDLADGDPSTLGQVNFRFANILFMGISSGDPGGVVFNSFSFTPTAAAVPEPVTWAMLITGFGMIGGAVRRRPAKSTVAYA